MALGNAKQFLEQAMKDEALRARVSEKEPEEVAGGDFWAGDDAPDGHEMGCFITFHQWWTCEENKWWCHNYYYGEHGEIINR